MDEFLIFVHSTLSKEISLKEKHRNLIGPEIFEVLIERKKSGGNILLTCKTLDTHHYTVQMNCQLDGKDLLS